MNTSSPKAAAPDDPFLFFGQGFGTSERCLEGFLWHERPPDGRARTRIVARLPFSVSSFARFDGELLHFGSGDDLEARVSAAHHPDHSDLLPEEAIERAVELPTPEWREWKAFNRAFERAVREIHRDDPLVAVIKPDDGVYGRTLGRWHQRSVTRAHELAERATQRSAPPKGAWSAMVMNLLEDVLPTAEVARKLRAAARLPWIAWLDRLVSSGDRQLRSAFAERLSWILDALVGRCRAEAIATLSAVTRRHLRVLTSIDFDDPASGKDGRLRAVRRPGHRPPLTNQRRR